MKKKILFILIIFTASACLFGCSSEDKKIIISEESDTQTAAYENVTNKPIPNEQNDDTAEVFTISAPSLSNNLIGEPEEQEISVYLPIEYSTSNKNYPVIYYLPGFGDSHSQGVQFFLNAIRTLRKDAEFTEMIVVCINGNNILGGSFYTNSPVTGNWEDFIVKDVVSYIDANYRTIANSSGRAISGHSMGGSGTISISMHTKDIFCAAYALSPGLFDENGLEKSDLRTVDINEYNSMTSDKALEEYRKTIPYMAWPENFTFAYGSAFAYDTEMNAPFFKSLNGLSVNSGGNFVKDDVYKKYESGFGDLKRKTSEYAENLNSLKGFKIDYGEDDEFVFIPDGCQYFSEQLTENDIGHELLSYTGGHQNMLSERIRNEVIPFFSDILKNSA